MKTDNAGRKSKAPKSEARRLTVVSGYGAFLAIEYGVSKVCVVEVGFSAGLDCFRPMLLTLDWFGSPCEVRYLCY